MNGARNAIGVFGWVTLLALVGAAAADEMEASAPDLAGVWKLERKENFEEYLKASGAPWWKRKLAQLGSSKLQQTISIDANHVEIASESPVENRTMQFTTDGSTELTAEGATGDVMTWTARFEGAAFVIDGHGDLGHRIIRREVEGGMMLMTILNPDVDAQCRLYFARAEVD